MPSVTEEVLELSAQLFLAAASDISRAAVSTGQTAGVLSKEALVALINYAKEGAATAKEKKAAKKLEVEVREHGEVPRQVTILESDLKTFEKWLKKQDVLYVALKSEMQKGEDGHKKCMVTFLDKDREAVETAIALSRHELGYINELPPQAFLTLSNKKDLSVVDNLDTYELETFRELAKDYGLVYSVILNAPDESEQEKGDAYKILVSKKDFSKAAAIMQQIAWCMTGEFQNGIKEKVKERYTVREEIQHLVRNGVEPGEISVDTGVGGVITVQKAKYIINKSAPSQYIRLTSEGFTHYKFGKEIENVSKDDSEFEDKLQYALGEFNGAVVVDAEEWEKEGLKKENIRKRFVAQKTSVFPQQFSKEKDIEEIQKSQKHKEKRENAPETAWLFDRYDLQKQYSEVYEANYNNLSEPPERTVSVHYGEAVKHAEKYKYIDVSNDEKSIDNIILSARERSMGNNEYERTEEKEVAI